MSVAVQDKRNIVAKDITRVNDRMLFMRKLSFAFSGGSKSVSLRTDNASLDQLDVLVAILKDLEADEIEGIRCPHLHSAYCASSFCATRGSTFFWRRRYPLRVL